LNLNLTYDELSDLWQDKQRMHFEDDSKQLFKQIHAFKLKASKYKKHLKNLSTEFNLVANDENIDNNI
ncbi:MAG: hypothetical protein WCR55_14260, partial [Lentisphaerota bacterium]